MQQTLVILMMTGINKYGATDIDYPYDVLSSKHLIYTVSETRKTIGYLPGCLPAHLQPKCQFACVFFYSLVVAFLHPFLFFHFISFFFLQVSLLSLFICADCGSTWVFGLFHCSLFFPPSSFFFSFYRFSYCHCLSPQIVAAG